jgi:hypothetical protein
LIESSLETSGILMSGAGRDERWRSRQGHTRCRITAAIGRAARPDARELAAWGREEVP